MKIRNGFVSNSSSSSFLITNKTNNLLNLVDFVKENPQLVEQWNNEYGYDYTQEELIESAENNNINIQPGVYEYIFGDEDGTLIGRVFDYILRDGGESVNFKWNFKEYYR
jgi:hypothetical protein